VRERKNWILAKQICGETMASNETDGIAKNVTRLHRILASARTKTSITEKIQTIFGKQHRQSWLQSGLDLGLPPY